MVSKSDRTNNLVYSPSESPITNNARRVQDVGNHLINLSSVSNS